MSILGLNGWLCPRTVAVNTPPKIVAIGGDDIGPEVTKAAVRCLRAMNLRAEISEPLHGEDTFRTEGTAFPDRVREEMRAADAILYGAWSGRSREILRFIRYGLDTYVNIRPARSLEGVPAVTGAGKTDLVIVRELTENFYPGTEGSLAE